MAYGGGSLGALGAAAGAMPNAEMAWQRVIQGRQRLQQAARQQQAMEGWFKSLVTPDAGAIQQQGPPGMTLTAQRGGDGSYSVPQAAPPPTAPAGGAHGMPRTPAGPPARPGKPFAP